MAAALAFIAHIAGFVEKIGLLCAALIVRCVWLDHEQKISQLIESNASTSSGSTTL